MRKYHYIIRILTFLSIPFFSQVSYAEAPQDVAGAKTIGITKAHQLYKNGAVFIDVRNEEEWSYGHIDGAVHLDFNDDEFVILYLSDALDREMPIVFYSDSPLSTASAMASYFAASWGYTNVYFFRDGYYSWLASDMPMELRDWNPERRVAAAQVKESLR